MTEGIRTNQEIKNRILARRAEYMMLIKLAQLNPDLFQEAANVYEALEELRWVSGVETSSGRGRGE